MKNDEGEGTNVRMKIVIGYDGSEHADAALDDLRQAGLPRDAEALQNYFRALTTRSRYSRFLGAVSELPPSVLEDFIHIGEADRFRVVRAIGISIRRFRSCAAT